MLDATTGQNAHSQVEIFKADVRVTGLVVTKLDGSAKGGVLVALAEKFELPVHAVGVGESAEDLRPFDAEDVRARADGALDCLLHSRGSQMAKAAKTPEITHPHPGEILASEFLEPKGIAAETLAKAIDVPTRRIKEILAGKRGIDADSDLRLARYLGVSEGFFMALAGRFRPRRLPPRDRQGAQSHHAISAHHAASP